MGRGRRQVTEKRGETKKDFCLAKDSAGEFGGKGNTLQPERGPHKKPWLNKKGGGIPEKS